MRVCLGACFVWLLERGVRAEPRCPDDPAAPELTCVPINTAVTVLVCSPAGPRSPARDAGIQHCDTLGREGTVVGSEETEREILTT